MNNSNNIKTFLNWSSGKDAALALYSLYSQNRKADLLLTTISKKHQRISMHGIRKSLLEAQLAQTGIPSLIIELPEDPDMKTYNQSMAGVHEDLANQGYTTAVYGDIFLEDLRKYRENQLSGFSITPEFPLWKKDSPELISEFIEAEFKAIIVSLDNSKLGSEYLGQEITMDLVSSFPESVDPCGENGEFHTFCFDGPVFKSSIGFEKGEITSKRYPDPDPDKSGHKSGNLDFLFLDLIPV